MNGKHKQSKMPNFDRTGPFGEGSKTGKQNGKCNSGNELTVLGRRMRQHSRGCSGKNKIDIEVMDFNPNEIVGIKKCGKKHHSN